MAQGFSDGEICIMQLHIFSDKTYFDAVFARLYSLDHLVPFAQVGRGRFKPELAAHDCGKT